MAIQSYDVYSIRTRVHQEIEIEIEEKMDEEKACFSLTGSIFENR
jgi:hypothetical protein